MEEEQEKAVRACRQQWESDTCGRTEGRKELVGRVLDPLEVLGKSRPG